MLGKLIKELRESRNISIEELACKSGLSKEMLTRIEEGAISSINLQKLLKIADGLQLKTAYDFVYLMKMNSSPRRFHAYNVGLIRTGTTSIAGIFNKYRSGHEMFADSTTKTVNEYNKQMISKESLRQFIRERDIQLFLEMDSSHIHRLYLDILAEEFPSSKFIFTIRDCYSWLDALINWILNHRFGKECKESKTLFGLNDFCCLNENDMRCNIHVYLKGFLSFWASSNNNILQRLPQDRSLVIRTHEIPGKINDISHFLGISPETLDRDQTHKFKAHRKFNMLHRINYEYLKNSCKEYCTPLMKEFFPGYTLKDFLNGK
jgi:transcriptional regulator with XRE-family HTH domain